MGLSHLPGQGERRALHDVMHEVKESRHTQARQALFGKLDERVGPITDHVPDLRSQGFEALVHRGLPCGVGAIVCDVLKQQIPRCHGLKDQHHALQKRLVGAADDRAHLAMGDPVLLPGLGGLSHRLLQHVHHLA